LLAGGGSPCGGVGAGGKRPCAAVTLSAAVLAICAALPVLADTPASFADRWWPGSEHRATPRVDPQAGFTLAAAHTAPVSPHPVMAMRAEPAVAGSRQSSGTRADGLASFYGTGTRTASGERFNPRAMTAAHRTLPFGTRVRVTDVATGRSVLVRVNDRGPFIPGRVIDVSQAAAEELGMVGRGVARVKLDVVR